MTKELQEKLKAKYPNLFHRANPPKTTFDAYEIECWDGWYEIIDKLCFELKDINNFQFRQIKQKFGLLRIYFDCEDIEFLHCDFFVQNAENESKTTCEKCGSKSNVSQNKNGYILTLCGNCRNLIKE